MLLDLVLEHFRDGLRFEDLGACFWTLSIIEQGSQYLNIFRRLRESSRTWLWSVSGNGVV